MFHFKRPERSLRMPAIPKMPSFKREKSLTRGLKSILKKTASGLTPRSSSKITYTSAPTLYPSSSSSSFHTPTALSPPVTVTTLQQEERPMVVKPAEDKVPAIMVVDEGMRRKGVMAVDPMLVGALKPVVDLSVPNPEESVEDLSDKAVVAVESMEKEAVADEVLSTSDLTEEVEEVAEAVTSVENKVLDMVADDVVMLVTNEGEALEVVDEAMGGLKSVDEATSMKEVLDKVDVAHGVEFVKDVADALVMKVKALEEEDAIQVVAVDEVIGGTRLMDKAAATSVEAPQDEEEEEDDMAITQEGDEDEEEDMPITQQGEQGAAQDQYVGVQDYEPSMEEDEEEEGEDEDEEEVRAPVVVEEEAVVAAPVANPSREPTAWSLGLLVVLPVIASSLLVAYLAGRVNLKLDDKVELPVALPFMAPAAPVVPKDTPFLIRSEDGLCFNGKKCADCSKSGKFTLFPEDDYSSEEGGHIRFEESERCLTVKYKGLFRKKHVVSAGECSKPESQGWHFNDGVLCHNGLCLSHQGSKALLVQSSGDRLELVVQQPTETEDTTLSFDSFDFTRSAF